MDRDRFFSGIALLVMAAFGFVFVESTAAVPIAIALAVIGIVLIVLSIKGADSFQR